MILLTPLSTARTLANFKQKKLRRKLFLKVLNFLYFKDINNIFLPETFLEKIRVYSLLYLEEREKVNIVISDSASKSQTNQ